MPRPAHLVVDISGHGLGHAAQLLPIVRRLTQIAPKIRVTLRTSIPADKLRAYLPMGFATAAPVPDPTLTMVGPMDVDREASRKSYQELHEDFDGIIDREASLLHRLEPDLVVADVPYVSLAAAHRIGVPAIGLSSLDWKSIYEAYLGDTPEAPDILDQIDQAYRRATLFIGVRPHLPFRHMPHLVSIDPVARAGEACPTRLKATAKIPDHHRLVTVAFGGIEGPFGLQHIPMLPDVTWLFAGIAPLARDDVRSLSGLPFAFADVLASSDLVITKVGYGTVAEAAIAGIRMMVVRRPDWPETPPIEAFVAGLGGTMLDRTQLAALGDHVLEALKQPAPLPVPAAGITQGAEVIARYLG